ncbi:MAG: hypothetical protein E6Y86_07175 [Slackia sp.]|nr:hypothetical protein [Slackia sp.]
METVRTKFGNITQADSDFGYGHVFIEDGKIVYGDMCGWKTWKTVRGFERWVDKQNVMSSGAYDKIRTREYKPRKTVLSWC